MLEVVVVVVVVAVVVVSVKMLLKECLASLHLLSLGNDGLSLITFLSLTRKLI
jgi:hypothetical protein